MQVHIGERSITEGLAPEHIDWLAAQMVEESVPDGKAIVREGTPADAVYVIVNGTAAHGWTITGNSKMGGGNYR